MLVGLELNKEKTKIYNERIKELRKEYPDMIWEEVKSLEDKFMPYIQAKEWMENSKYIIIQKDYKNNDEFNGIYICDLNENHTLEMISNYKEKRNCHSPIYWYDYGVADNASQVLDYYQSLYQKHEDYMKDKKYVILMVPFFRQNEPELDGWRWYKWGPYIGKFNPEHEYLYEENGIDYIYCFHIYEVELNR